MKNEKAKLNLDFYKWEEIKKIFLSPNIRDEKITKLKNIELVENTNIK